MTLHVIGPDDPVPPEARGATVALGNFDGVHLGHAAVLRTAHAARPDAPLAVLTFEPHPREFFRPEDPPFRLSLLAEKADALANLQVAWLFELRFDTEFSRHSADYFVSALLHDRIGAKHLVCGADFAFGHRRGGDVPFLAARAEALGIGLSIAPAFSDLSGPISSTRIRRLLQDGYPERANALLGRSWSIRGVVTHGDKRGRTIGFPTANIPLGRHLEPARGVYAVTVRLPDGGHYGGVANIGRRPTVSDTTESRLEVNLYDFDGDLYDLELTVSVHAFLRAEQKFASLDALKTQIAADAQAARLLLQGSASP
jgi:riboflavin kinase / FMN adenylyltransferase